MRGSMSLERRVGSTKGASKKDIVGWVWAPVGFEIFIEIQGWSVLALDEGSKP